MGEFDAVDLMMCEPQLRARIPFLRRRRPYLPVPEVTLLLDRRGRIVRQSSNFAGDVLGRHSFAQATTVHDALHPGCRDDDCEFLNHWHSAWKALEPGLPVEWLYLCDLSPAVFKLRLQPVTYACHVLYGTFVDHFADHYVLFIQDLSGLSANELAPARQEYEANANLYERRRDGDTDPDLVASLDHRLREQTRRLLDADDAVRRRLAQELHDSLGQTLSMLRIEIESVAHCQLSADGPSQLDRIVEHVQHAQRELRSIIGDLRAEENGQPDVCELFSALAVDFGNVLPNVDLLTEFEIEESDLPDDVAVAAYRIMQEALHNVARHSGATRVLMSLTHNSDGVSLLVSDNGCGPPEDVTRCNGLGLITMRERADRLGAQFRIDRAATGGCEIRVFWPATMVAQLT